MGERRRPQGCDERQLEEAVQRREAVLGVQVAEESGKVALGQVQVHGGGPQGMVRLVAVEAGRVIQSPQEDLAHHGQAEQDDGNCEQANEGTGS